MPVPGSDLPTAAAHLAATRDRLQAGRLGRSGELRIRIRDDGRLWVGQLTGQHSWYPHLSGRLERSAEGTVQLVGTARESALDLVCVGIFVSSTLVLLLGLGASLANGDGTGIAVSSIGSVLLGSVGWVLQRARRTFPQDVAQQLVVLRHALGQDA